MQRRHLTIILFVLSNLACASNRQAIQTSRSFSDTIHWPAKYAPEQASFFVHNSIEIQASPERVWQVLIQAEAWPQWYEGASNVEVLGDDKVLKANSVFTWTTMGFDLTSTVREFVPNARLSWEADESTIQGYHGWLIIPTERGCILVTDESQNGFLTFFEKIFQPNTLHELHDIWLQKIKEKAETTRMTSYAFPPPKP